MRQLEGRLLQFVRPHLQNCLHTKGKSLKLLYRCGNILTRQYDLLFVDRPANDIVSLIASGNHDTVEIAIYHNASWFREGPKSQPRGIIIEAETMFHVKRQVKTKKSSSSKEENYKGFIPRYYFTDNQAFLVRT